MRDQPTATLGRHGNHAAGIVSGTGNQRICGETILKTLVSNEPREHLALPIRQ